MTEDSRKERDKAIEINRADYGRDLDAANARYRDARDDAPECARRDYDRDLDAAAARFRATRAQIWAAYNAGGDG